MESTNQTEQSSQRALEPGQDSGVRFLLRWEPLGSGEGGLGGQWSLGNCSRKVFGEGRAIGQPEKEPGNWVLGRGVLGIGKES